MSASKVVLNILQNCLAVLIFILVLIGLAGVGRMAYNVGYRIFTEEPITQGEGRDAIVEYREGMSPSELGDMLEEKGLVRDGYLFAIQMRLFGYAGELEPGVYTLNTSQTAKEMLSDMAEKPEDETEEEGGDGASSGSSGSGNNNGSGVGQSD